MEEDSTMGTTTISTDWATFFTNETTAEFIPMTGWMPAKDIASARVQWEIAQIDGTGTTTVQPAYQPADFADSPQAAASLGTAQTTRDVFYPTVYQDMQAALEDEQLVRFGVLVSTTAGNTGWGRVQLQRIDLVSR
jgi:hypothetical protein